MNYMAAESGFYISLMVGNRRQWLTSSTVLHLTHMVTLTDLLIPATQHSARC